MKKSKAIKDALESLRQCRGYPVGCPMSPDVMREYDRVIESDRRDVLDELWDRAVASCKEKT